MPTEIQKRRIRERRTRKETLSVSVEEQGKEAVAIECQKESNTTDAEAEARQFVSELARNFALNIRHRYEYFGIKFEDVEKANDAALAKKSCEEHTDYYSEVALKTPPRELEWTHLTALGEKDMQAALDLWWRVREWATDELDTGGRTAKAVGAVTPQDHARFQVLRDSFIDAWQPKNQIEKSMVEILAQTYSLYLYWSQISHERAINTQLRADRISNKTYKRSWETPYQHEADAIDQAYKLADGYNRQFLRTLRQLRDLRRYVPPVIVNNGGQVNVANQQVNVAKVT